MALKFDNTTNTITNQTTNGDLTLAGNGSGAVVVGSHLGVGIDPAVALHVEGYRPKFWLQSDADVNSRFEIDDPAPTQTVMRKVVSSSISLIDINPMPMDGTSTGHVRCFRETNTTGANMLYICQGDGTGSTNAGLAAKGSSYVSYLSGNFGIRSNSFGTGAVGVVSIGNGTPPTSSPANSVQLFAKDVADVSELWVRNEDGYETQLSSHSAGSLEAAFPGTDDEAIPLPFIIHHRNEYVGCEEWIHLSQLAQAVEELTGKKFIFRSSLEKRDWETDQEIAFKEQQKKIDEWQTRKTAWEAKHDTPFDDEAPRPYEKASLPGWVRNRVDRTS